MLQILSYNITQKLIQKMGYLHCRSSERYKFVIFTKKSSKLQVIVKEI